MEGGVGREAVGGRVGVGRVEGGWVEAGDGTGIDEGVDDIFLDEGR